MYYSLSEIFAIGIGPSSSHTVGPMKAAKRFVDNLAEQINRVSDIKVYLYGSLALTGVGHGTLNAIVYGLMGYEADKLDLTQNYIEQINKTKSINLRQAKIIAFSFDDNFILEKQTFLKEHPNGMKFVATDPQGKTILEETYFSVGGGSIARIDEIENKIERAPLNVPFQFSSFAELRQICEKMNMSIRDIVLANENTIYSSADTKAYIQKIVRIMQENIDKGITTEGTLPGSIRLLRRAPGMHQSLQKRFENNFDDALYIIDWVNLWAFAVAEENAAGGKIVTAPTMGSAGIMPAVMRYYQRFAHKKAYYDEEADITFLTTAAAICCLYRSNASISGAEVGCQGEVGVACSMAAAGLTAVMGGNINQIENAAEIGMEHNLGLTCDPINGLVQIPCIERNAMAAIKAVNASRLAMRGSGQYKVSLDSIIKTMYETGLSLQSDYKETSLGGLAKNVIC
ncbi:L-serine ammonia-lyase [bacterium]|nr:L-serine ammonia-lyase [bacterium]MBR2273936.1 L-serine ammonia-lyase [Alphaproteobacteria bacterium]